MGVTQEQIKNALKSVKYPGFSRDIVSFGLVKEIVSSGAETRVQLVLTTNEPAMPRAIKADAEKVLRGMRRARTESLDRYSRAAGRCRQLRSWRHREFLESNT